MFKVINHLNRPTPNGFSHAMEVTGGGRTLYIAGQVGRKDDLTVPPGIIEQSQAVVANINALLAQAGMTFANVAKCTVYLTDESYLPDFVSVWYPSLPSPPPAVTGVIVKALVDPAFLVEVEVIAIA